MSETAGLCQGDDLLFADLMAEQFMHIQRHAERLEERIGLFNARLCRGTLIRLIPTLVMSVVFVVIYVTVPNTKVHIRSAIIPGILAAIFMQMLQQAYLVGQTFLSGYNAIYGSLAALPLFMLWVQFSWYIILFFAELNYTSQNKDFFELRMGKEDLSYEHRLVVSSILLSLIFIICFF